MNRERERGKTDEDRQINRRRNNAADTFFLHFIDKNSAGAAARAAVGMGIPMGMGVGWV